MKTIKTFLLAIAILTTYSITAQVAVSSDGSDVDPSAMLEVKSTEKGFLPPGMTREQIEAIENPANGLMVFNTSDNLYYIFLETSGQWRDVALCSTTIGEHTCGDDLIDLRDGQSYATLLYGTQCWMVENLNIGTKINSSTSQSNNSNIEKYCFNNLESNCDTYGGLYQWKEMMKYTSTESGQGICPLGWHIPSLSEGETFNDYIDEHDPSYQCGGFVAGSYAKAIAATTLWDSSTDPCSPGETPSTNNASGFNGLPGGYSWYYDGAFNNSGIYAIWWMSSSYSSSSGYFFRITNGASYPYFGEDAHDNMNNGYSVRCIKD